MTSKIECEFLYSKNTFKVPSVLLSEIYNFCNVNLSKDAPTIKFGFLGRYLNIDNQRGSISSGSHCCITNSVQLDIPTYKIFGSDAMFFRLIHELLHDAGCDEVKVLQIELELYRKIHHIFAEYIVQLQQNLNIIAEAFEQQLNKIAQSSVVEIIELQNLCKIANNNGYPLIYNNTSTISVVNPITKENVDILFL